MTKRMEHEQKSNGERCGKGDRPGGAVVEKGEPCSDEEDGKGEERQMAESKAGDRVGWVTGVAGRAFLVVFPGVDEEAVQAA